MGVGGQRSRWIIISMQKVKEGNRSVAVKPRDFYLPGSEGHELGNWQGWGSDGQSGVITEISTLEMLGNGNRSKEGWRQWNGQDLRAASRVQWPVERMRDSALNGTKYGGWPRSAWKSVPPQNLWVRTQTVTAWMSDSEGRVNCIKLRTSGWLSGEMICTAIWGNWFCYEW